jgi:imidazolonepropionase-like amidohydrolase
VRLAPGAAASATVLARDGRIARLANDDFVPPSEARRIDGEGGLLLPAFLDAYTTTGCATPEPKAARDLPPKESADVVVDMREANRKGVQPSFRAADAFNAPGEALQPWRESGFGALLAAPAGQILSGQSALVVTREAAPRDAVVRAGVFDHAGFDATGPGYPSTLMGSIAQLRQFLLDAAWQRDLAQRRAAGKPGPRLPFDADLEAIGPALRGERRVCCEAQSADDVDRWLELADAHHLRIAIAGGREAWKRAGVLAQRKVPVLLTLAWGEEPPDPDAKDAKKKEVSAADAPWTYEEPLASRRERRRLWLEDRDGALRLAAAGVDFAFGTGKDKPKELLERVRQLVAAGLPRDAALRALTQGAAAILGVDPALGRLEEGRDAAFAVWTKDPLTDKDAQVSWLVVDGHAIDLRPKEKPKDKDAAPKPADGLDATGTWTLDFGGAGVPAATAELKMEPDGRVRGRLRGSTPDGRTVDAEVEGRVAGTKLDLSATASVAGAPAKFEYSGALEAARWQGELEWSLGPDSGTLAFRATREPKEDAR